MIPRHEKTIPQNLETLNRSFSVQAPNFDSKSVNFTKKEYLDYIVTTASPAGTELYWKQPPEPVPAGGHLHHWFIQLYVWTQQLPCSKSEDRTPGKII